MLYGKTMSAYWKNDTKRIITPCGQKSVLLVLMKVVQIITTVLQTVEKAWSGNLGENMATKIAQREPNGTYKTAT
jgi:hypothetical protein